MDINKIRRQIIKEEMEFPKSFTFYEERDYGILYHNIENPNSGDSNHSVIYPERITDLRYVLNDIANFYESKGSSYLCIYHPFVADYFIDNAKILKECGYEFTISPDTPVMLLTEKNKIDLPKRLDIRHIANWDESINNDVLTCVANKEHFTTVIKNSMGENNYLFIGYIENEAASLLAFHVSKHGVTRFDEMGTAEKHKNKGYAREMNRYAADFVRNHNLPIAYQWPAHKTSERITTEAGFKIAFTIPSGSATLAEYR
ncbi:MAG: hypothetical protein FWF92_09995 [Oscillospiraceae bacterium]|nr:hypothetical protein [Oscillospiraceae bacterium]